MGFFGVLVFTSHWRVGKMDWEDPQDALLRAAARELTGWTRRVFIGEVTVRLCDGNARRSERRLDGDEKRLRRA